MASSSLIARRVSLATLAVLVVGVPALADARPTKRSPVDRAASIRQPAADDGPFGTHQHDGTHGHLPATKKNVSVVGKLKLSGAFGDIVEGQIADVSVFKQSAYLNSWDEESCKRGGTYVVDISNPAAPKETGFIPAPAGNYHGEGAHVITANTTKFKGDLLAVNNEFCSSLESEPASGGGFDLYDVSDPKNPKVLVQGAGDRGKEGVLTGSRATANEYHSVFLWQHAGKVYAVGVDNEELADVDIFDVSDPRNVKPVAEFDLAAMFPQIRDQSALNDEVFLHDMVVKTINGVPTMQASYWDAGYVTLDVSNPARPKYLADSTFDGADPLTGKKPPEGNAHQSEFSFDNQFILAADEDFAPYRSAGFSITSGPNTGAYPASEVGGGTSVASLPDLKLNGAVVYGGYGCDGSSAIPPRSQTLPGTLPAGEEAIVVLQRGPSNDTDDAYEACFPGEKAKNGKAAGYDAVLLVNRHPDSGVAADDEPYCGSGGYPPGEQIVTLCTSHQVLHRLFNDAPEYTIPYDDDVEGPASGRVGDRVLGDSEFDGWGYAHVFRNNGGKLAELGQYAVPESLDPAFAFGYGDLSIHEFATDPDRNLAYASYYSAGVRVVKFGATGIQEAGRFIDEGGNDFWGIEQFTTARGERLFAASDRSYGLYLFKYTGK